MAAAAGEGDEVPLAGAVPSRGRPPSAEAAALAALVALAALAALASATALAAAVAGARGTAAAQRGLRHGGAAAPACEDTPNWTNGYWECGGNAHRGPNCQGRGLTCEAYAASGWCQRGGVAPGFDKAFGQGMAWPELNCCACGGGSQLSSEPQPQKPTDLRQGCVDTPGWTDGKWECTTWKSKPIGCTPRGLTCAAYQAGGLCLNGAPAPGKEFVVGREYLFPEKNCCACGGGYNVSSDPGLPAAAA